MCLFCGFVAAEDLWLVSIFMRSDYHSILIKSLITVSGKES